MDNVTPEPVDSASMISVSTLRPKPRWRLQVSLRLMLLLSTVSGIGLGFFYRPWTVDSCEATSTTTTSYRRRWNGRVVKHGVTETRSLSSDSRQVLHYDNDLLVRTQHYEPFVGLVSETFFDQATGRNRVWNYRRTQGETVIAETISSRDSGPHLMRWATTSGKLLQSWEFQDGWKKWNDRAYQPALSDLLSSGIEDESHRAEWQRSPLRGDGFQFEHVGDGSYRVIRSSGRGGTLLGGTAIEGTYQSEMQLHFQRKFPTSVEEGIILHHFMTSLDRRPTSYSSAELLLNNLIQNDFTVICRFGALCVVPVCEAELQGVDFTGAMQVTFPSASQQSADWLDPRVDSARGGRSVERLTNLFANTSIELDHAQVVDVVQTRSAPDSTLLRSRRDIFGLFLWYNGYRVKQQGNKLIVLPVDTTKVSP